MALQLECASWSAGLLAPAWPLARRLDAINGPGCYVCHWSGHLLRVPQDGVAPGRSPLINMVGTDPLFVTKISHNSYIAVTKARLLAANSDLAVNF